MGTLLNMTGNFKILAKTLMGCYHSEPSIVPPIFDSENNEN